MDQPWETRGCSLVACASGGNPCAGNPLSWPGADTGQAASGLSDNLREWVNQLTPDGQLPDVGGLLDQGVAAVKGLFDRF